MSPPWVVSRTVIWVFFLNLVVVAQSGSGNLRMNFQHKICVQKLKIQIFFLSSTADFCKYSDCEVGRNTILGSNPRKVMAELQLKGR
jgi:hypothetical protein